MFNLVISVLSVILSFISVLTVIFSVLVWGGKILEGQRCNLRQSMLHTYYTKKDAKQIRQYEYENFIKCYEAYKALKGNSFIDKIMDEVSGFEIIS